MSMTLQSQNLQQGLAATAHQRTGTGVLISLACALLLIGAGLLHGGVALSTSAWDPMITFVKDNILASSLVIFFAFVALIIGIWQATHGQGYGFLKNVLGVLILALIVPTFVVSGATLLG